MSNCGSLVSIITPCYNGARYLERFFGDVLSQTYSPIELIFVDDGSTDNSLFIAESFRPALERRGILFKLLHQDNGGQASAINRALPEVTGDYITWPDCDDGMEPDNISKKVAWLERHPEDDFVCCQVKVGTPDGKTLGVHATDAKARYNLFSAFVREEGAYCNPLAYLSRSEALFEAIGGRKIYESPSGQNWQLLLPLAYKKRCGFIDEPLATYFLNPGSHSNSYMSVERRISRANELEDILIHVFLKLGMDDSELERWVNFARIKYSRRRLRIAAEAGDRASAKREIGKIDSAGGRSVVTNLIYIMTLVGLGAPFARMGREAKKMLRAIRRH